MISEDAAYFVIAKRLALGLTPTLRTSVHVVLEIKVTPF